MMGWNQAYLQKALDNRIGCFAVILLLGSISQSMVSTGAFEVYFNGESFMCFGPLLTILHVLMDMPAPI